MWAWLRMLCNVPTGISDFLGTMAVSTNSPERRTNLTWLPFWLVSTKPAASRRRLTSRKGWGLSRPNLDLDQADLRRPCCLRRFEVQFNRFLEIVKSLFLGVALAGDVEFEALGDIPPPLAPNGSRKWSLHELIVSKARALRTAARVPMVPSQIRSLTAPRELCWRPACFPRRSNRSVGWLELARWGHRRRLLALSDNAVSGYPFHSAS